MHTYRRVRYKIVYLKSVSYCWGDFAGLHMMSELHSISERKSEIRRLPVKSHIGDIPEIKTGIERIQKIYLKLKSEPRQRIITDNRPKNKLVVRHPMTIVNRTIFHQPAYMPFIKILSDDNICPCSKCVCGFLYINFSCSQREQRPKKDVY
jgi:hypothetical protein